MSVASEFVAPTSLSAAFQRAERIEEALARLRGQLADSSRLDASGSDAAFIVWWRRATARLARLEEDQRQLEGWIFNAQQDLLLEVLDIVQSFEPEEARVDTQDAIRPLVKLATELLRGLSVYMRLAFKLNDFTAEEQATVQRLYAMFQTTTEKGERE